jgi:hypothetical protein
MLHVIRTCVDFYYIIEAMGTVDDGINPAALLITQDKNLFTTSMFFTYYAKVIPSL